MAASSKPPANNTEKLNEILDSDEGARYIGEFSLAFNPHILHPMRDILFDEKIAGSFHFTPGQAYDIAGNGNKSRIHWDMVDIQRRDYGGGEVWFDGKLIRKDGLFVLPALKKLNPDYLLRKVGRTCLCPAGSHFSVCSRARADLVFCSCFARQSSSVPLQRAPASGRGVL